MYVFQHQITLLMLKFPCRIRVVGVDNLNVSQDVVYVEAGIYHGSELLGDTLITNEQSKSLHPRWNQWLVFDITVKNLPKADRLCLKVRQITHYPPSTTTLTQIINWLLPSPP